MKIDVKTIRDLAENIEKYNLQEVSVESDGTKVTLKREIATSETTYVSAAAMTTPTAVASKAEVPAVEEAEDKYESVDSPMMGTYYKAPSPDAPDFVKEGQEVKQGDTLCIVEAMKLMNEIKASRDGKIVKILLKDGAPVVKGDKLFLID
ncbi:acetyl-CoA carboxylase biotin carboxyl carrier protein [Ilyobacter polytropus]|uniref:Biotin carboxyl carrier protein of acetyl-CoA carboxylase n=1 Tax=Ilyobacter polytropus (strain ATCC 51220 / DSM 2926 / LMG 16218 / CuHBu1) TaxID=572544 RepID=E3H6U6_ILYPC|nr:acetyl-CoA carboxylase biotin carboxyl carrier protein [Ilyobacter polytropus]ADO82465.1 acetyl-CoA carboxylase, biotin carboxyl carrier protein [Ilyobacter polytropus DSM 2926]